MEKRYLYGDASLIEDLLSKYKLIETAEGGYAAVYRDPVTKSFWLKYYATSAAQGGGYLTLMRLPAPTTEELIDLALSTEHEDELVATVLRLLDEEAIEKKSFRHTLIRRLEQQLLQRNGVPRQRIVNIIKLSGLDDPMNRREVLGRTPEQVQQDAEYFMVIAERAKNLLSW